MVSFAFLDIFHRLNMFQMIDFCKHNWITVLTCNFLFSLLFFFFLLLCAYTLFSVLAFSFAGKVTWGQITDPRQIVRFTSWILVIYAGLPWNSLSVFFALNIILSFRLSLILQDQDFEGHKICQKDCNSHDTVWVIRHSMLAMRLFVGLLIPFSPPLSDVWMWCMNT